jgi:UDP-2-acetamido-3-amino-2,3-dideoxy-glucuronate N-acetyltransferase
MSKGLDASVFVHEKALCESEDIGSGTRVWAFAHIMEGATIGADCNICDHAFVESGAVIGRGVTVKNNVLIWDRVTIEDEVFLGPNVVFTNDLVPRAVSKKQRDELSPTLVRRGTTIGANATIVCGITIGTHAFVGAGSVVTADIPDQGFVVGNPARRIGWACVCGLRLPADLRCTCGRGYRPSNGTIRLDPERSAPIAPEPPTV